MVGQLIGQAPLNWNDSLSVNVLHHLLTSPLLASATLAALLDKNGDREESKDWHDDLAPPAMMTTMVPRTLIVLELLLFPRLSRPSGIAHIHRHLVSNHGVIRWKAGHHCRHVLSNGRMILLLAVSVSIHLNRVAVLTRSRGSLEVLIASFVSSFVSSLMVTASPVTLMTFMTIILAKHRMFSFKLRLREWLSVALKIIMTVALAKHWVVSLRHWRWVRMNC